MVAEPIDSLGAWIRRRRRTLDLTQQSLAERAACALPTIKKIEADERRPSPELAASLATALELPTAQRETFVQVARGLRAVYTLDAHSVESSLPAHPHRPAGVAQGNPPVAVTSLVGRARERAELETLLADPAIRLVTIVGPGGIGKTRLALACAESHAASHEAGMSFVPLAALEQAQEVAPAIARALGLYLAGSETAEALLERWLAPRALLLVLDNAEHILEGLLWLDRMLARAPHVKVLVTSRERLGLEAEWLYRLEGLDLEAAEQLFRARARRAGSHLDDAAEHEAIHAIGRLVDGSPLAIELAAGWASTLTCAEIAGQVRTNLDFLATSLRTLPERQRSLRAVLDQSWRYLAPAEQKALMRLSVFRDGWRVEEAAAVLEQEALALLRALSERALVRRDAQGRYSLHELTRQYAADRLAASALEQEARTFHLYAFVALVEQADAYRWGPSAGKWTRRMSEEQPNLGAAWDFAVATGDLAALDRILYPLAGYWLTHSGSREGAQRIERRLALDPGAVSPERAMALGQCASLYAIAGNFAAAAPLAMEFIPMAMATHDLTVMGFAYLHQGLSVGDFDQSCLHFESAAACFRSVEHRFGLAMTLNFYGDILREHGELAAARARYVESVALFERMGAVEDRIAPLGNLGRMALHDGDVAGAHAIFAQCVAALRASEAYMPAADWSLRLATTAFYLGNAEEAAALLAEAERLADVSANWRTMPTFWRGAPLWHCRWGNCRRRECCYAPHWRAMLRVWPCHAWGRLVPSGCQACLIW